MDGRVQQNAVHAPKTAIGTDDGGTCPQKVWTCTAFAPSSFLPILFGRTKARKTNNRESCGLLIWETSTTKRSLTVFYFALSSAQRAYLISPSLPILISDGLYGFLSLFISSFLAGPLVYTLSAVSHVALGYLLEGDRRGCTSSSAPEWSHHSCAYRASPSSYPHAQATLAS
jgi:hypothetical protein